MKYQYEKLCRNCFHINKIIRKERIVNGPIGRKFIPILCSKCSQEVDVFNTYETIIEENKK